VVFDPWQAVGMAQRLRTQGVSVEEFTFSSASVGRLAGTLHRLLRDGLVALPDDEELLDELAHVRLVEKSPGVVRMDHASGRHDDRAVCLAMAAQTLLATPAPPSSGRVKDLRLRGRR
jgi:phage FluMu gp28-like protein